MKIDNSYTPNASWLHGKYIINGMECEIHTSLPYIAVGDEYFAQGEEADNNITEIHQIWLQDGRRTPKTAFAKWIGYYL